MTVGCPRFSGGGTLETSDSHVYSNSRAVIRAVLYMTAVTILRSSSGSTLQAVPSRLQRQRRRVIRPTGQVSTGSISRPARQTGGFLTPTL